MTVRVGVGLRLSLSLYAAINASADPSLMN